MTVRIIAFLGVLLIRTLRATLRIRHVRAEYIDGTPQYIVSFWHECMLLGIYSRWRKPITSISSQSKDGDMMVTVLSHFGVGAVRGSSTRGGDMALRQVLRRARDGSNVSITPDGPKGPRRVVKEGAAFIARASGLPVVPFYFTAAKKKRLGSWDGTIVPRPFSRALFLYGPPITVPRDGNVEEWRVAIETQMNALADEAERDFDALWTAAPRRLPEVRT